MAITPSAFATSSGFFTLGLFLFLGGDLRLLGVLGPLSRDFFVRLVLLALESPERWEVSLERLGLLLGIYYFLWLVRVSLRLSLRVGVGVSGVWVASGGGLR